MSEKSWVDDEPVTEEDEHQKQLHTHELKKIQQEYENLETINKQRKILFVSVMGLVTVMFVVSYCIAIDVALVNPSTQGAILSGLLIMVPVVLLLAMIRVLYQNRDANKDNTAPSIMLNLVKEIGGVVKDYIKTKS